MTIMNTLFLLFAGQGLFLAFLLSQQKKIRANPWISLYFLSFSIILLNWVVYWNEDLSWKVRFVAFAVPFQLFLGPLLYFSITQQRRAWLPAIWHFVPGILSIFLLAPGYISVFVTLDLPNVYLANFSTIHTSIHYSTLTGIIVYIVLAWKQRVNMEHILLIAGLACFVVGYSIYDSLSYMELMTAWIDYIIAGTMTISFYAAGYYYFIRYKPYSAKNSIDKAQFAGIIKKMEVHLSESRAYLDAEYRIEDLAADLKESTQNLSLAIGVSGARNFKEYINSLRINHAKELLRTSNQKVLAVALESGYNNKVSFIQNFKKFCQMTPTEYRESLKTTGSEFVEMKTG